MSTALPAGAAAFDSSSMDALFTSGEADDSQKASEALPVLPERPDEESPEELPETPDEEMPETPEVPDEETSETPDGEETPESPEEELPEDLFTEESETTEDAFSAGTEEGTLISAEGAILVTAEDWEKTEEGFKLHKAGELPESEYEYYTEEDGILLLSTEYKDVVRTGYYLFDTEGYLVTGKKASCGGYIRSGGRRRILFHRHGSCSGLQ